MKKGLLTLILLLSSPFFLQNIVAQHIKQTMEEPTISAGAEYSIYLQNLINSGRTADLKFNGKVPPFASPNGIEAITTIEGINFDEDAANNNFYHIPPDPIGAAGPTHLVSVTNTSIE